MDHPSIVLVTGFAPWASHDVNPSTHIAHALDGVTMNGISFRAHAPLPVQFGTAADVALRRATELGAKAIVAFGLAAATPYVRIEKQAKNEVSTHEPDARGESRLGNAIVEKASARLATACNVDAITSDLVASGVDARISDDAGGYVCNDLYYRLLRNAGMPVLFVHVPTGADTNAALPAALASALSRELNRLLSR